MSEPDETAKRHAREMAAMDQAGAAVSQTLPPILHGFYAALLSQGFEVDQALQLTESLMLKLLTPNR